MRLRQHTSAIDTAHRGSVPRNTQIFDSHACTHAWWTSSVTVPGTSIHWRKLERDAAATCNLHMGTYMHHSCAHVQVALLLHLVPTCADGCWCLVSLIFSNSRWWCFSIQQLAQTLHLHLWCCPLQLALVVFLHVYVYNIIFNLHCIIILTNVRLLSKHKPH